MSHASDIVAGISVFISEPKGGVAVLRAQGSLNSRTVAHALTDDSAIDMSSLTFVEPIGLVAAAALSDRAVRDGQPTNFVRPVDFSAGNYCSRMGLKKHFDSLLISNDLPTVAQNPHPDDLLELQKFSSEFDGTQLAQLVYNRVTSINTEVDAQVPNTLYESLCELASNVTTHAEVTHGYVAAQTYPAKGTIVFAVSDSGIGVRQSLAGRYHPANDQEALQLAVQYGVSTTGEGGRGSGLHDVMDSVVGLRGTFTIISGSAKLVVTDVGAINPVATPSYFNGTLIQGELSCVP